MTTEQQQYQRSRQGTAPAEDVYGWMANSLMPLFEADGFLAFMYRRDHPSHPWGPPTITYRRSVHPGLLDAFTADPHDTFRAIAAVASASEKCQVRLLLVRRTHADPFNDNERRLAEQLIPLLRGVIAAQLLLEEAREHARGAPESTPAAQQAQPWQGLKLTRAEGDVLDLLLQGLGVKQISQRRRSSYHTVRSQLASLLSKANCHSQRELIFRMSVH